MSHPPSRSQTNPADASAQPSPPGMPQFPTAGGGAAPPADWEPGKVEVEFGGHVAPAVTQDVAGGAALSSAAGADLGTVQALLQRHGLVRAEPSFALSGAEADLAQAGALAQDPDAPHPRNFVTLYFPEGADTAAIAQELSLAPEVVRAVPVPRAIPPQDVPPGDDPLVGSDDQPTPDPRTGLEHQWYLFRCEVNGAWDTGITGSGVVIADIDWGFRTTHQDLAPRLELEHAYNAFDGGTDVQHGSGVSHGTAVLGLAGAAANGVGMSGVAPHAALWPVQADSGPGAPLPGNAWANAIDWVRRADSGGRRKIINLEVQTGSFGNYEQLPSVSAAIRLAIASGVVVCVAAGNGNRPAGVDDQGHPFPETGSILVGATAYDPRENARAWFSNYGPSVVVAAPGDSNHDVTCGIQADDAYQNEFGGTSGATPKVSGTVALMLEANPALTHAEIRDILRATGGPVQTDTGKPVGTFLNAAAAVQEAQRRKEQPAGPAPGARPAPLNSVRRNPAAAQNPLLASATELSSFRTSLPAGGSLSRTDRLLLVDQALALLEGFYVHRPLKEAMYAIRPVQRLRLLRYRLEQTPDAELGGDLRFHNEMTQIFVSLRDLHTNYLLPDPFRGKVAFLPFYVEAYYDHGVRKYLVSRLVPGFTHPTFVPGVEITHWNGIPMERAVELNAELQAGSNPDARHARGLEAMTIRPLVISLPPDEEWEIIGYRTAAGQSLELRQTWQVFSPSGTSSGTGSGPSAQAVGTATDYALGVDIQTEAVRRTKQILFAPETVALGYRVDGGADGMTRAAAGVDLQTEAVREVKQIFFAPETLAQSARLGTRSPAPAEGAAPADGLQTQMPGVFKAREVTTPSGKFGYIRIFTFSVNDPVTFVREFVRLAQQLPQNGLIIDVRGNGGGLIYAGEMLLQVLTPRQIEPERLQFINTPLTLELCTRHAADLQLQPWTESIRQSVATGATYSRAFPITSEELCNGIGQKYVGPALLVTDALCYSTTDIFSAGFQDHQIGPILGVSGHTGAGGANVWTHSFLTELFAGASSPLRPLPQGGEMRVAIRETLRVGPQAGTLLEDLGVVPDQLYRMTRKDLLEDNVDLINAAAALLQQRPVYVLTLQERARAGTSVTLSARTAHLDRLDFSLDSRPQNSLNVTDGEITFTVNVPAGASTELLVRGFQSGSCAAAQRLTLNGA